MGCRSLFAKLVLALLVLFCVVGALVGYVTLFAAEKYQQEVCQKMNQALASHIIEDTQLIKGGQINQRVIEGLFHTLMTFNPALEIYLLDDKGGIVTYSAPPWKVKRLSVALAPIQRFLKAGAVFPITGDDPRNFAQSKVFSVAPVQDSGGFNGYLYVILGGEEYESILQRVKDSYILKLSFTILLLGLLGSTLAGMFMVGGLIRRIKKLQQTMTHFQYSASLSLLEQPSNPAQGDEVDQLSATFYAMARTITQQFDDLKTNDHLRRELVANVSHDLRTPLATLQGYIETLIIKDSTLDSTARQDYLSTAIKHCQRLNQLVSELFELAKLDSHEIKLSREPFNLGELIQDMIHKFELRAKANGISLSTHIDLHPAFVYADLGMIERVLENLLENALRHTATEGRVMINLLAVQGGVEVRVIDTGSGIPENELPHIFDRFYQLDKTRNAPEGGSGLGLAIVKRIIELHQTEINATSQPGHQTVFSFSLPAYP